MVMVMSALRVVRSVLPVALYLDRARLTTRGLMRGRLGGMRVARTARPITPARSVPGPSRMPAARVTWSRAVLRAVVRLARSGPGPGAGMGASAMAVRMAW